jgi:hypothetical protein
MTIDHVIEKEFKEASRITKKPYSDIANYFLGALHKLDSVEVVYTEMEYKETISKYKDVALTYTRDFIWFDEHHV